MRLLFDQGLPTSAASILRTAGWDVIHASEAGLNRATDKAVLDFARKERRVICTLDADFHAILAISGLNGPSVMRIRREGLRGAELAGLILGLRPTVIAALEAGAVVSVTNRAIRIRRLPVIRKS